MRRWFWHLATRVFMAGTRYCAEQRARVCPCASCYIFANRDRFVADAMREIIREAHGQPKVDRRPS